MEFNTSVDKVMPASHISQTILRAKCTCIVNENKEKFNPYIIDKLIRDIFKTPIVYSVKSFALRRKYMIYYE